MSLRFGAATGDRVDCGSGSSIDDLRSGANGFTILTIIRRTTNGANQHIVTKDQSTADGRFSLLIDNAPSEGCARFIVGRPGATNTDYITSTVVSSLNTWTFIGAGFKDAAAPDVSIYYSSMGGAVAEAAYNTANNGSGALGTDAAANLYIGNLQRATSYPFLGDIGVVAIVNRRMTLAECEDWKNNPRMIAGCVLFQRLGENGTGTQPDYSGNGNSGTITGATLSDNPPLRRPWVRQHTPALYIVPASSAVGAGDGVATSSAVGASANNQAGAGDGVATSSGVGASLAVAPGAGDGVATSSGVGASSATANGSGDGVATASGVGVSSSSYGSGDGVATCAGVGASIYAAIGTADGVSTVDGVSGSVGNRDGGWARFYDLKPLKKRLKKREVPDEVIEAISDIVAEQDINEPIKKPVTVLKEALSEKNTDYDTKYGELLVIELKFAIEYQQKLAQVRRQQEEEVLMLLMAA